MRRGFDEGLFKEEALPPLVEDDRGFLERFDVGAGEDDDENCVEAVGDTAWECCGVLALGMSTQTMHTFERYFNEN